MYYTPAIMAENNEHIENPKTGGWNGKEIHRRHAVCMVIEKSPPRL